MSAIETETLPPLTVHDRFSLRLLRSEIRLIATRRRNIIAASVLCGIPIVLALALVTSGAADKTGNAPPLVSMMYGNGLLVVLGTFSVESLIFLPLAVCLLATDAFCGEAHAGTLRYLLVVPIGRTRLLLVKFLANAICIVAVVAAVAIIAAAVGLAIFGTGELATLSGIPLEFGDSVQVTILVCLYAMAMLVSFLGVGMFVSTMTDQPAAAISIGLLYILVDQVLVVTPELDWLNPYLLTGYWRDWGDLLRQPMETDHVYMGLTVAAIYAVVGMTGAWARLTTRDVTS